MIKVDRASVSDIDGIGAVVHDVWAQEILPEKCNALVNGDTSALWVAKEGEAILGFASAFLTVDAAGHRRCEIDLLAVSPGHQRKGLGPRLITGVCQEAESWNVDVMRALVRVENEPSQRAFQRVGLGTDHSVHRLLLWSPDPGAERAPHPQGVSLIRVETVTYRGLWIEGLAELPEDEQRSIVKTARATIAQEDRRNAGALVPVNEQGRLAPGLLAGAKVQGDYLWLQRAG